MEYLVFDENLELIGEISEYISSELERNISTYSTLILRIASTDENNSLLRPGNTISDKENPRYGYYIQHFNYSQTSSEVLEIVAYSLNYLLTFRTIFPQQYFSGTHEEVVRGFINNNAISSNKSYRNIPRLTLGAINGIGSSIQSTKTGGDLLEHVISIANEINAFVEILINFETKQFEVVVDQGTNRSASQVVNPVVVFSEEFDNILSQEYFLSLLNYKTSPIVAGEGEGAARTYVNVNEFFGINRREVFVDARDLQSEYQDDAGVSRTLTPQEYTNTLISRGRQSLEDYPLIETFQASVDNSQFVYGTDYFVGDTVTVKNFRLGISIDVMVTSVTVVSDSAGIYITPTLGKGLPNVFRNRR